MELFIKHIFLIMKPAECQILYFYSLRSNFLNVVSPDPKLTVFNISHLLLLSFQVIQLTFHKTTLFALIFDQFT